MTYKHILIFFVIGFVITVIGALFKIMHWPGASYMLLSGMLSKVLSGILLIVKIINDQNPNSFLNK